MQIVQGEFQSEEKVETDIPIEIITEENITALIFSDLNPSNFSSI